MNTKGISGSNQIGPLAADKPELKSSLIDLKSDKQSGAKGSPTNSYGVNLSREAHEMADARAKALDIARNTNDVREDRVAELRNRIKSGQYKVDSGKIADGMLSEAIKDEVATQAHRNANTK